VGEHDARTIGVAIDVPQPWGDQLTRRRREAGDLVAVHVPAHVTLLGPTHVPHADLPAVDRHLADLAAQCPPFTLRLQGTGTFRPVSQVVFVVVVGGGPDCQRLHEGLLRAPAVQPDRRFPYHPHVTVAHDVPPADLDAVHHDLADFEAHFKVATVTLFEHDTDGRWRIRQEYPLAGRPAVS